MTNEQVLEKAKSMFFIGTKFKRPEGEMPNKAYTVEKPEFIFGQLGGLMVKTVEESLVHIYHKRKGGHWAEIIFQPSIHPLIFN